jgi:3-hydroxyisobutyrate dehydrogenase-like beta-hydroxyacid dehydrogenase
MGEHIGFIGLGKMGGPMAERLLVAGHNLTVHDVSQPALSALLDRGAIAAPTPAAVASAVETVIVSLPTPDIVKDVALGSDGIVAGSMIKTFVDLSTSGPDMAREVAAQLDVRGIASIDAPVSGGIAGEKKGSLAIMASGPEQHITRLRPVLEIIGTVFHVGTEPGLGQTKKLANNLLTASALALSAEAIVMGTKAGLDPQTMLDVINAGSGRNSATQDKFPRAILTRSFDFGFATGLMQKDVALYRQVAETLGVPTDLATAVETLWKKTLEEFGPDADFTQIVRGIEKRAGVEVKGRS